MRSQRRGPRYWSSGAGIDGGCGRVAIRPELSGVAETALWTLWFRAAETTCRDAVLSDPLAVEVLNKIDFPYQARFGRLFRPGR